MRTDSRDNKFYELQLTLFTLLSCILYFTPFAKYATLPLFPLGILAILKYQVIRKVIRPFFILVVIGLMLSISSEENFSYFFFKDLLFFIQVPVVIAVGFMLSKQKNADRLFLSAIMLISLAILLMHLAFVFIKWDEFILNPLVFHRIYGTNALNIIVCIIILKHLPLKGLWFTQAKTRRIYTFLILLYVLLSFSRTTMSLYLLVVFYGVLGWYSRRIIFLVILLVPLLLQFVGAKSSTALKAGDVTFLSKVENSVSELQLRNFQSQKEITHFWRGYEGFLGLNRYMQGAPLQLALGQGFGTTVSVPRKAFSDWSDDGLEGLKTIGVFHVGYVTILLKTGVIGLLIFLSFLYRSFIKKHGRDVCVDMLHPLIVYILITSFLTHGLFKADINAIVLLLIGMSYGSKSISV